MNRKVKPFMGLVGVHRTVLSQNSPWVEINPNVELNPNINVQAPLSVNAPINIELGGLPLSIGLFAASGLTFALRNQLKRDWQQTAALLVGAGLGAGGIVNLLLPKKAAAAPSASAAPSGPTGAPPTLPPPSEPSGKNGYSISPEEAFSKIDARITYPGDDYQVIDLSPLANFVPVRVQVINNSSAPVSFTLELNYTESPSIGSDRESTLPILVSVEPGKAKDVPVNLPLSTWGIATDFVEIYLIAKKRRAPDTGAENLHSRVFRID